MNREFEYLKESNRVKSFNEQMDEYLELERKELMNSIYNNPPKLVDRDKLKIVRESDNQQRVEAKIPQAPKLFDYDSVRMVREDKPVTPTTAPKPSYNYAQITPKRKNPFTPNSELWRHYDKILNSKQKVTEAKPINLKPEVKPTVKPQPQIESVTSTPTEPNKITVQNRTPNNKPTTPTVKIAEEASSVVTPTRSSPKGNVDLLRFGKFSQVEKPKEETDNIVTPIILNKELKVEKERKYNNKSINISVEYGALQSDEFSTNAHNYSPFFLAKEANEVFTKMELLSDYITHKSKWESDYKLTSKAVLSNDDNIYERVTSCFLNGTGATNVIDNNKKIKALIFDENSKISKSLETNPTFIDFFYGVYLENLKECLIKVNKKMNYLDSFDISNNEVGAENCINNTTLFKKEKLNFSHPTEIYSYDTYGLMGGVQKIKVNMEIKKINDSEFLVNTTMYLMDWYGADWEDIDPSRQFSKGEMPIKSCIQGLNAFFVLQHSYGCKPFATQINYEATNIIDINTGCLIVVDKIDKSKNNINR